MLPSHLHYPPPTAEVSSSIKSARHSDAGAGYWCNLHRDVKGDIPAWRRRVLLVSRNRLTIPAVFAMLRIVEDFLLSAG